MNRSEKIYKDIKELIMGNNRSIASFNEFKRLSKDQRDFYVYEQLSKLDHLDKRYAGKRVEVLVYGFVAIILVGFVGTLVGIVFTR